MKLAKIMAAAGVAKSNSEARRLIQQGAVEVNQQPMVEIDSELGMGGIYSTGRKEAVCQGNPKK